MEKKEAEAMVGEKAPDQGSPPPTAPGYIYPPPQQQNYPPPQPQAPYPPQQDEPPPYPQAQAPYPQAQAPYPQAQAPYQPYPQAPYQPYPQAPYQPPQEVQTTTVVTTQPVVVQSATFRTNPVVVTDSNGQQVQTVLEYHSGLLTWLVCGVICLITSECGLCCLGLIAFCFNDLKDVYHITPTDGRVVGVYKRIGF